MEEKKDKFEFMDEVISVAGKILHRIRATRDFGQVKAGDIGGFIQHLGNLSQVGECWVTDNACVYGNAMVVENAVIGGHAQVHSNAIIGGQAYVGGTVEVGQNVRLNGRTWITNHVIIYEGR